MFKDENDNADFYKRLYSKLAIAVAATHPERKGFGKTMLSACLPGRHLPPGLKPFGSIEDDHQISKIFDASTRAGAVYSPEGLRVSEVYRRLLADRLPAIGDLSDTEKEALATARRRYNELAPACQEHETQYWLAHMSYGMAKANGQAPSPSSVSQLKGRMDRWIAAGKAELEARQIVLQSLQDREGAAFWDQLDKAHAESHRRLKSGGLGFLPVTAPYTWFFKDGGWTQFAFNSADLARIEIAEEIASSDALDEDFGMVTLSASGHYAADREYIRIPVRDLSVKCDLMPAPLQRDWMNPGVFAGRAWKLDSPGALDAPDGVLAIPITAIVARNVAITGRFSGEVETRIQNAIKSGGSVGVGPFSIAGDASYRDRRQRFAGVVANGTVTMPAPQIIGFIRMVTPTLPNPDSARSWPS